MRKPKQKSIEKNFLLLTDQPISSSREQKLHFGHEQLANTLMKLIKKANPPFTLGLYGSWGSGKSTIVNNLTEKLKGSEFLTVEFDGWKYEGDSLRRQFLRETTKQLLGEAEEKKLREEMDHDIEFKREDSPKINVKLALLTFTSALCIFLVSVLIILIIVIIVGYTPNWREMSGWIVASIAGAGVFSRFFQDYISNLLKILFTKIIVIDERTMKKDKLSRAEEFQEKFIKIVENKKNKNKKILFILDNLDRTSHEKAVGLLTTVKTFLEAKNCIFLIPCDENAIKKHISKSYLSSSDTDTMDAYADEYLRKFFNAVVRIPRFEGLDLDIYTSDLLKETAMDEFQSNPNLSWIITSSFRNNPREIKQFINTLTSTSVLIAERINSGYIVEKNVLKENVAFLAKILIFKQKYPKAFDQVEEAVIDGKIWDEINEAVIDDVKALGFMKRTEFIIPALVDATFFFTLSQSSDERSLPQWDKFKSAALDRNFDLANELTLSFIKEGNIELFEKAGANFIKNNRKRLASIKPFIATYLSIYSRGENQDKLPIFVETGMEAAKELPAFIRETYLEFPISTTLNALSTRISKSLLRPILAAYIHILARYSPGSQNPDDKSLDEILTYIANDSARLFDHETDSVKSFFERNINKGLFLNKFLSSTYKDRVVTPEIINSYLSSLLLLDLSTTPLEVESLNLVRAFDLDQQQFESALKYARNLIGIVIDQPSNRQEILEFINALINEQTKASEYLQQESIKVYTENISSNLVTMSQKSTEPEDKPDIFRLALTLYDIPNNNQSETLKGSLIEPYMRDNNYAEFYSDFDRKTIETITANFSDTYIEACIRDSSIYLNGKQDLTPDQKEMYSNRVIDTSIDRSIDAVINDLGEKLINPVAYLNNLFERIEKMDINQKKKFFKLIHDLRSAGNADIAIKFYSALVVSRSDLTSKDIRTYSNGIKTYITKDQLKEINSKKK